MTNPFSPNNEAKQARKFRLLAAMFETADTMGLCERFAILAVLSEQKARVLKELEDASTSDLMGSKMQAKLDWPTVKLHTRNEAQEN
jgi:hypothetical protein